MSKKRTWISDALWLLACLGLLTATALYVAGRTGTDFFAHGPFDSYTRQALAWRDGRMMLDGEYPWLELAIFEGEYYVSFPPVPSVPMWVLSFFFGLETPDALMCLLYWLGGAAAAFFLARRYLPAAHAAGLAALNYLLDNKVVEQAEAKGALYETLLGSHPAVREIRRSGLLMAVELGESAKLYRTMELFKDAGILSDWFLFCDTAFRISPPLTISEDEVRESAALIRSCLDRL